VAGLERPSEDLAMAVGEVGSADIEIDLGIVADAVPD
jgi:hypothetical protein